MTPLLPWRPAILSPTERLRLRGDVDLHHLEHAGRQLVAAREPVDELVLLGLVRRRCGRRYSCTIACSGRRSRESRAASTAAASRSRTLAASSSSAPSTSIVVNGLPRRAASIELAAERRRRASSSRVELVAEDAAGTRVSASRISAQVLLALLLGQVHLARELLRRRSRCPRCPAAPRASRSSRPRRRGRRSRAAASPRAMSSLLLFGATLPTRMSPGVDARADADDARPRRGCASARSETFGMSRVNSSRPSFVSRISISNSSMWIEVNDVVAGRGARRRGSRPRSCSRPRA